MDSTSRGGGLWPGARRWHNLVEGHLLRILGHGLFAILATLCVLYVGEVCHGVFQTVGEPYVSFSHTDEGFVNPVSLEVWGADQAGLRSWDRIVAVDGELVFGGAMVRTAAFRGEVPRPVTYQVAGMDGDTRFVRIPTRVFSPSDLIRSHASQALLGLVFIAIAILLYFFRPGTVEAWTFFLFSSNIGLCMTAVVNETMLWRFPPLYGYLAPFLTLTGLLLVGALSRAFTWNKTDDPAGLLLRRAMYAVAIGSLVVSTAIAVAFHLHRGDISAVLEVDFFLYSWLFIGVIVGVSALFIAYRRGRSPRRRARIRQILWAIPVGAGIPALNLLVGNVFDTATISFLWNGFLILLPIATADAIVRHDLLHLNITARRLIGGMLVAAVMGMGLGFVLWAAANFLAVNDPAGAVALAALLFAFAAPVNHRVQRYVESLLRSRRYDAGRILADFTADASTSLHLRQVAPLLEGALSKSVQPSRVELYRVERHQDRLIPLIQKGEPVALTPSLRRALDSTEPRVYDDEMPDEELPTPWAALALRLAVANQAVGLLILGDRTDELAYEGSDVAFVESLSGPLGAALVNTRAYEEVQALNQALEQRVVDRTRALEDTNRELELLNQRKDELVATVSHDFRSPLAIIRQNVQTIQRDLGAMEPDDLKSFLASVARQEQRLTDMCESLLDLARLKQGADYNDDVDVAVLSEELVDSFRRRADKAGVELIFDRSADAPVMVFGDGPRLQQILQNLVDNAIKFTPPGGRVAVRLLDDTPDGKAPRLRVEVEDTGCGVPEEDLPRLFEPFFQVPRQSHVGQGSGLGLAIVKAVVQAHDGTISVSSEEGRGTLFTIRLPGSMVSDHDPDDEPDDDEEEGAGAAAAPGPVSPKVH